MEGEEVTPTTQEMIMSDIWIEVMKELHRAETKHPLWPTDTVYAAAIVAEESGELMQAALQRQFEGGELEACEREAIQTIVTCIRFVKNIRMENVSDPPLWIRNFKDNDRDGERIG